MCRQIVFEDSASELVFSASSAAALEKTKAKGGIAITGTLGFDVNYIREFKMEDGTRKIRFVTDRPITFGEVWGARRSLGYPITMGEINIGKRFGNSVILAEIKEVLQDSAQTESDPRFFPAPETLFEAY